MAACTNGFGATVDLQLKNISQLQQIASAGGIVSLAPATSVQNVGASDVPVYSAIAPVPVWGPIIGQHPYVVFHLYRVANGSLKQIGRSDVSHLFYATNEGCGCTGGQVLFSGCSITSSTLNNSDQFYFGPRTELTAHLGAWSSLGSHFDGIPVDNIRDHDPAETDNLTHLLLVPESDLQTAGAEYYIEAWYIAATDTNIFNNIGFRRVTPSFVGGQWTFAFNSTLTNGPAINAWVNPTNPSPGAVNSLIDSLGQGHLRVATKTTSLGGGTNHYEYAVMNLDLDRKIRAFSVPIGTATVSSVTFLDVDSDAGNDWQPAISSDQIQWATSAADPDANALPWGALYTFAFNTTASPTDTVAMLTMSGNGSGSILPATIKAPATTNPRNSFQVVSIVWNQGNIDVTFTALAAKHYRLEWKNDLADVSWTMVSELTTSADGLSLLSDTTAATESRRFYHVALVQ